jgi:hypothetical protein
MIRMTGHNSRIARELLRLPPRPPPRHQPAPIDHPIKGKLHFGNSVTAVYSALLREVNTKGDAARFHKTGRGQFARKAQAS